MPRLTMAEGGKYQMGEPVDMSVIGEREAADVRVLGGGLVAALFKGLAGVARDLSFLPLDATLQRVCAAGDPCNW